MKSLIAFLLLMTVAAGRVAAQQEDRFTGANRDYGSGNFKQAVAGYEDLVHAQNWNAPLFYNLGNSYFRLHQYGKAILSYQRALALEPSYPEARTNLGITREEAHALELPVSRVEQIAHLATPNEYTIAGVVLFWTAAFLFAFSTGRGRGGRVALGLLSLLLAALLGTLAAVSERGPQGASLAIVTADETQARLATADTAANVLTLPAGSELKIEQKRGEWAYAFLPNGTRGWVPLNQIEPVRL